MPHLSKKRRAEIDAWRRSRSEVAERGLCQAHRYEATGGYLICGTGAPHLGADAHHKRRRSQGGTDDPTNLLWVCRVAHRYIHDHPAEAVRLGLLERNEP